MHISLGVIVHCCDLVIPNHLLVCLTSGSLMALIVLVIVKVQTLIIFFLQVRSISKQQLDECVIQCQMSRIAASQGERIRRPRDQRTRAMSLQITGIFQGAIRKSKYPGSQIDIYVQVNGCY